MKAKKMDPGRIQWSLHLLTASHESPDSVAKKVGSTEQEIRKLFDEYRAHEHVRHDIRETGWTRADWDECVRAVQRAIKGEI